jgi:hypothetical protein
MFDWTMAAEDQGWSEVMPCAESFPLPPDLASSAAPCPIGDYAATPPVERDGDLPGRVEASELGDTELLDLLVAIERQIAFLESRKLCAIAEIARRDDSADAWSREAVMCALRMTGRAAETSLRTATALTNELTPTMAVLQAGRLSAD